MTYRSLALATALLLVPMSSLAQIRQPPPGQQALAMRSRVGIEGEIFRYAQGREGQMLASPTRLNRAERIAALINAGDCAGARNLAISENDRRLARRVAQICSADN